jgi:hypothetical protein
LPRVRLDLNEPSFQETWFALESADALRVLASLRKIGKLTWDQLYRDAGLKWEAIPSQTAPGGERLYSFRVTQRIRAVAYSDGDFLSLQRVHADHDSAYH